MKQGTHLATTIIPALLLAILIVRPESLYAAGATDDQGFFMAQYIEDKDNGGNRKKTVRDYAKKEPEKPEPRFIMGIGGGVNAREGFGSASLGVPLGVQYGRFIMVFDTTLHYSNAKSLRKTKSSLLDSILRTKLSGHVVEFDLPFKFSYLLLDLEKNPYTPYFTAGIGYAYRKFYLRGSTSLERITREYGINSFTMHFGFGFLVRTSDDTRFNVGITGVSHFNNRSGEFNYDTTGVSIGLGMLLIF